MNHSAWLPFLFPDSGELSWMSFLASLFNYCFRINSLKCSHRAEEFVHVKYGPLHPSGELCLFTNVERYSPQNPPALIPPRRLEPPWILQRPLRSHSRPSPAYSFMCWPLQLHASSLSFVFTMRHVNYFSC